MVEVGSFFPQCRTLLRIATGLEAFALAPFIDHLVLAVAVGETELHVTAGRDVGGQLLDEHGDNIVNGVEAYVRYLTDYLAFEIGATIDHHAL